MNNEISFLMYSLDEEDVNVNVRIAEDTIWLSQKALAELFGIDRTGIGRHLKNIFEEGELDEKEVCAKFAHTTSLSSSPSSKIFFKCLPTPVLSIPNSSASAF